MHHINYECDVEGLTYMCSFTSSIYINFSIIYEWPLTMCHFTSAGKNPSSAWQRFCKITTKTVCLWSGGFLASVRQTFECSWNRKRVWPENKPCMCETILVLQLQGRLANAWSVSHSVLDLEWFSSVEYARETVLAFFNCRENLRMRDHYRILSKILSDFLQLNTRAKQSRAFCNCRENLRMRDQYRILS